MISEGTPRAGRAARSRLSGAARPDVSVVVVHFDAAIELKACLESLATASDALDVEVFVVDNASVDFSPDLVTNVIPTAKVHRNSQNVGYARAANRALRAAQGRYVLVLNPDTILRPDAIRRVLEYMDERPGVGCATPRLVQPNGRLDPACRRSFPTPMRAFYRMSLLSKVFPKSRRFGAYNMTFLDEFSEAEIDSPSGAFMMVRREVLAAVGLLDERYFMYGEDLDWAYRMKQAGWRVMYTPVTTVVHLKRSSTQKHRRMSIRAFYDAMRIFYRSHYESRYPLPVNALMYAGINAREALELAALRITTRGPRA